MKKLAMKMLSLLLVLSLLLPTCVFAQPGQDGDGTPGTQSTTSEKTTTFTEGGNSDEDADAPTGGGSGDEDADAPTGGGNSDEDADAPTGGGNGDEDADAPTGGGNGDEDADVSAEEAAPTVVEMEEVVLDLSDMDLPDNDELFAAYVEREFDRAAGGTQYPVFYSSSHATRPLTDTERRIYNALKTEIEKIANGTVHDTQINVTIAWTAAELGGADFSEATTKNSFIAAAGNWDIKNVSKALLADCAYELYWYDKTQGVSVPGYTITPPTSGGTATQSYTVKFYVAKAYSAANAVKTYVTRSDLSAVSAAVSKAGNIVTTYAGKSDDEKLDGYFAEIRTLVDYNYDALATGTLYGDPWQMIYVFDNDPATKVVCEGYAKAFQYLCEKSSPQIKCYNVTGKMNGGDHMWNVVEQGGTRYLVDVTNCDDGKKDGSTLYGYGYMVNPRDCYLYMKTGSPSTDGKTHTFTFYNTFLSSNYTVTYVYEDSMKDLFCEGYPKLGTEVKHTVTITKDVNMTVTSGSLTQDVLDTAPMTEVILTAADGYYFPVGYTVSGSSGVTVTRLDYRQIKVSGTPTADATINLASPTAKTLATLTTNPAANTGLKYNGNAQELVTAGSGVNGGTLQYSLSSGTGFSTAIPKGTNAGSYVVYYKVVGDDTHIDTTEKTINVSIGQKTPEASDFVFEAPSSLSYDGNDKEASVTLGSLYSDAGAVTVKYYNSTGTAEVTERKNVGTYVVKVDVAGGTNYASINGLTDSTWKFTIVPGVIPAEVVNGVTGYSGTYDGNPHNAVVVGTNVSSGGYTVKYSDSESGTYDTTQRQVKNASSKTVWVEISKANYAAVKKSVTATVSQKDIGGATITLGTQATYDGSTKNVGISKVTVDGKDLISTIGYTIKSGKTATDVGNTTLVIEGTGNYTGEASAVWSLVARELTLPSAAAVDKPYDGNNAATVNGGALSGVVSGDDVALAAGSVGGTFDSRYAGTNINVTAEAFTLTGTKAGNYTLTQPTGLKADITAADQTPTIIGTATLAKGGSTLDLSTLVNGAMGDVSFSISSGGGSATLSGGTTLKSTDTTGVVKIDVNITPRSVGGDGTPEYKAYAKTAAITVTVADKTSAPLAGGVTQSGCTYGETLANPVFTKPTGTTITTYFYEGTLTKDGSYYTGLSKPTEAGTYTVKVTCETATHIYMGTALFTIEQKDISGMDVTLSKSTTPYTGSSQSVTVSSVGTLILGEYTVGGTTSGTQVGTYTVTVTGHGNYKGTADKTWEIKKATLTITGATVAAKTYDGTDGATVSSVSFSGLASSDTLTRGTDYDVSGVFNSANVSSANKVTVTVTLKDTATAKNYKLASATYDVTGQSITQATTPAKPTGLNGVKGNALSTVALPSGWTWVSGSTVMNSVGSQTFKANYNDAAGNYASATGVDVTVDVKDKTDVGGKISFNDGTLVYTGAGQKYETASISGITAGMGVTWTYGYTAGTGTLDGGLPKTVGTYTVTVTYEDSLNYGTKSVTLTITQATPTGAPKFTKITSSGKTLGDAALVKTVSGPGDGFSVAGTVEWVDGSGAALADSTSVEANKSYGWKFTPTDSNYKSISGSVVVYTVRRVSHSGGAAADSAAAAAAQPTVYSGSRGESVKTLQERLNAKGYNAGSVDGIFGKNTRAAVMAFQKANGLAADGIVGKLTWAKLYDTTAALPAASTATGTQPMVYRGSRGDAVRKLQELLNKKGFDCGAVDGIFGSKTYAAVVAFQKANGLGADGIVGPLTWGKLG